MIAPRLGAVGVAAVTVGLAQGWVEPIEVDFGSPQRTSVENDDEIIERTRHIALAYTDSLPNFICTQENRKFKDESSDGSGWTQYAEVLAEVRFLDRGESYRTISVDGRPAGDDFKLASGESGTFGSRLAGMFLPRSKAEFTRAADAVIDGRSVYVFEVLLPTDHLGGGLMCLGWDDSGMPIRQVPVGGRGLVSIEKQTGNVLRIERLETLGLPVDYPIMQARYRVDYGSVPIGDDTYLLPVRAQYVFDLAPRLMHKYELRWRDCRKFEAESVLTFERSMDRSK